MVQSDLTLPDREVAIEVSDLAMRYGSRLIQQHLNFEVVRKTLGVPLGHKNFHLKN